MAFVKFLLAAGFLAAASPALACDNSPDLPLLPGETPEANKQRNADLGDALAAVRSLEEQRTATKLARRVYLGRVLVRTGLSKTIPLFSIEVQPAKAIKGALPTTKQVLADVGVGECGTTYGGGHATNANVGEWIIVFDGLPERQGYPRGVFSIFASEAIQQELVDAVEKFALDQADKQP